MMNATKRMMFGLFMACFAVGSARAEVLLQWFESDWDEMYQKLPFVAEIGYDNFWIPPPTKGPAGRSVKWANVGYNLYDRFDIGDVPQRGTRETRYGSRGSLRNMVDNAHGLGIKIIPDIVMNHNGNGPDIREYPGMSPNDFHLEYAEGYVNTLNFKRAPRMDQWYHQEGYGGTMWQELAQLIDIRTEDHPINPDPKRFTGQKTIEGRSFNFIDGTSYVRHVGQYDRYPYAYTNENAAQMLYRWIAWLGNAMDYDGLRLDAGKHTPYEFFGWRGAGFLHEAQWNYTQRRGYNFGGNPSDLFANDRDRTNAFIFAEILSPWSEIEYWYGQGQRNPMRFLDYQMKETADASFGGNLAGLGQFGSDFGPSTGITYVWGHDEALNASKPILAYAYILCHVGVPMVYYTCNNITWDDYGRDPSKKTWMIPGFDSHVMGEGGNGAIPNLVFINQNFARGNEFKRWENDSDFFALERYDDLNGNGTPNAGEGIMILALNDSGSDQTRTLSCAFPNGTVLKDYTGNNGNNVTVNNGQATITVPGTSRYGDAGQGWVVYAPLCADGVVVSLQDGASPAGTIPWVIPGGTHAASTTQQITRITSDTITVTAASTWIPAGINVDNFMLYWGDGKQLGVTNFFDASRNRVSGRFHNMNRVNPTNYNLTFSTTNLSEGLHLIKARAFTQRDSSYSAIYNTGRKVVYVDRHGPELDIEVPASFKGDALMVIRNPDFTAYEVFVKIDGGAEVKADEIMKGLFHFPLQGLSAGGRTITVRATEFNYANPRTQINGSTNVVNVTVQAGNGMTLALDCPDKTPGDSTAELPFFKMIASGASASAKLYWDGYELPWNAGNLTNVFNGQVIQRDNDGRVVTNRLWGNFINGGHTFVLKDGDYTTVKRVVFNLYGNNHIDSDGDGIPDNVEMPFFEFGAPGPDVSYPGDNNNFIPESWETWTRLNPYNHSTFYSVTWDDRMDMDGDGFTTYEEVVAGYFEDGNIYKYNTYDGSSKPSSTPVNVPSSASASPQPVNPGATLSITYTPNGGVLSNAAQVFMHIGHSKRTLGSWQDVVQIPMTRSGSNWTADYAVPAAATSVDVTFFDGGDIWDGRDWQFNVLGAATARFQMDTQLDSPAFEVASYSWMKLWAAVRGTKLYVATWGTGGDGYDHCIYVATNFSDASPSMPGWNKGGFVFLNTTNSPFLAGEGLASSANYSAWQNTVAGSSSNANFRNDGQANNYMEGEIDLVDNFGSIPAVLYVAAAAYQSFDGGTNEVQVPAPWDANENIEVMEILRVPVASIRDENADGFFDGGSPLMWTVVNGNTNDANYGLRRFFIDEVKGDQEQITVIVEPNAGGTNQVTEIEVFSNLNRRDYVKLPGDEDPNTVTSTSLDTYYRGYPMASLGDGRYSATITINRCGAYRVNARYRINGGPWRYYTDNGLRRDCAVVVSPKKALDTIIYEFNPLTAEATTDQFAGRSTFRNMYLDDTDRPNGISTNKLKQLGVNMIWLQPIHPIGTIGRQIDPTTSQEYDPGSPYAVKNYWQVNSVLGDPATPAQAMTEFTNFVHYYDASGIGVMLDGTFNHSAWDAEVGEMAVEMGLTSPQGNVLNPTNRISAVRPAWYSKKDSYGEPASYFTDMNNTDIAPAPDRIDFGKWNDAADFFFGRYDALVQKPAANTNWTWSSSWWNRYLREDDVFEGFTSDYTRELWEYFAAYPLYWLEKTGHPAGTPKNESWKGIDGLRCDFAQGLPSEFWEYTINKTRSVKWDFLYMAESLDGYRTVDGSTRHGVGYRSARHFDILNENILYMWRDTFFNYRTWPTQLSINANRTTSVIFDAFDARKNAFEMSPVLLNLISHDEIFPTDDQWSLAYAYAINAAMDGVPMVFFGQEMGAQNDYYEYGAGNTDDYWTNDVRYVGNRSDVVIDPGNNFGRYELNFSKSIPHFKRYNHMTNIWNNSWAVDLNATYARINRARQNSPALRSQQNYFLSDVATSGWNPDIFAVAKFQQPGISAATQDVVFAFINNNFRTNESRAASFKLDDEVSPGVNRFGIQPGHLYNVVNITATNPAQTLWPSNYPGSKVIAEGVYVEFKPADTYQGGQVQFLRLLDITAGMTATSVNDMATFEVRKPAPQIAAVSNRTVAVGNTLSFTLQVTKDPSDSVTVSAASTLSPVNWTFSGTNYVFSFTPATNETGVHTFLFTATGNDGFDEELITITVTAENPEPGAYELWAQGQGLDIEGANGGLIDDFDGDGVPNQEEFWADTSPTNANVFPQISSVFMQDGVLNIRMDKSSDAPRAYVIHAAGTLASNSWDWQTLGTNNSATGVLPVNGNGDTIRVFKITIPPVPAQ